jgi:integrase
MKLIQSTLAGLALPDGKSDVIYFDDDYPGLGLRLRKGGKRTWIFQFEVGKKQRRMTIGTFPAMTLGAARKTASELHARVRLGEDPASTKQEKQRQAADTVNALLQIYWPEKQQSLGQRTRITVERHLLHYAKPLHGKGVASITRRDISDLSTKLAASSGNPTANKTRSSLSTFFGWCIKKGLIEENPVRGSYIAEESPRERMLTIPELIAIWRALDQIGTCGGAYAAIIRLLILTGQRREEIGGLRFDELRTDPAGNLDRIELPPPRTKPKRAHTIPLSGPAQAILTPWLSTPTASPFVFGDQPFVSWSLGKRMLDEALVKAKIEITPWVVHDIRRSVATGLADHVDTLPHVIEAVLNHSGRKADAIFGINTKLRETYVKSVYENG